MGFISPEAERAYLAAYDRTLSSSPVPVGAVDVDTPFGSTHVITAGPDDAPPLVVLHGKHCSSTMWLDLLPTLSATHRTYLVDGIGELGRSVSTRAMSRSKDVAAWLDAVLAALAIDRAAFVGFSNGGFLATTYAIARPERVERLALLAPVGAFKGIAPSWWRSNFATMGRHHAEKFARFWKRHSIGDHPSPLQEKFDEQFLVGADGMRYAMKDVFIRSFRAKRFAALTMPVLAVFADRDICHDGPATAAKAKRRLPSARVELLADSGHLVTFDQQSTVASLLADFLGQPADLAA